VTRTPRRRTAAALSAAAALSLLAPPAAAAAAPPAPAALPAAAAPAAALPTAATPAAALPTAAALAAAALPAAAAPAAAALPAAARAGEIPCPKPKAAPPPNRPPRPVPPPDDPVNSAVGGDALATHGLIIPAGATPPPAVTATTWLVADLDTGEVLGACGPHVYQTPASVQKTLLAATVMDRLDPNREITVVDSDLEIERNSSAVGLVVGGKYKISTLWLGLLLNSGNDAANTLARLAGGGGPDGVARTVAAMNAEAHKLGAFQTHAVTPSGLDGRGQFTSAYDLALIARVCFASADFRRYALTRSAQMPAQPRLKKGGFQFQNENKLIFNYPGALGGKTGFTTVARHSYVGGAQRNGRRLVVTLLGAEARPMRGWQQGAALLDWGFAQPKDASVGKLVDPQDVAAGPESTRQAPVANGSAPAAAAVSATRPGPPRALAVAASATVAVVLAGTPLLLLLTQRRRRAGRRPYPRRRPVP
jgi:D-alanyl-D-alanine carboxypeptidase (penicillin-binding protein 5/6)